MWIIVYELNFRDTIREELFHNEMVKFSETIEILNTTMSNFNESLSFRFEEVAKQRLDDYNVKIMYLKQTNRDNAEREKKERNNGGSLCKQIYTCACYITNITSFCAISWK